VGLGLGLSRCRRQETRRHSSHARGIFLYLEEVLVDDGELAGEHAAVVHVGGEGLGRLVVAHDLTVVPGGSGSDGWER